MTNLHKSYYSLQRIFSQILSHEAAALERLLFIPMFRCFDSGSVRLTPSHSSKASEWCCWALRAVPLWWHPTPPCPNHPPVAQEVLCRLCGVLICCTHPARQCLPAFNLTFRENFPYIQHSAPHSKDQTLDLYILRVRNFPCLAKSFPQAAVIEYQEFLSLTKTGSHYR